MTRSNSWEPPQQPSFCLASPESFSGSLRPSTQSGDGDCKHQHCNQLFGSIEKCLLSCSQGLVQWHCIPFEHSQGYNSYQVDPRNRNVLKDKIAKDQSAPLHIHCLALRLSVVFANWCPDFHSALPCTNPAGWGSSHARRPSMGSSQNWDRPQSLGVDCQH